MIVTEEEAKTKLCPEAIGVGDINWVMVPSGRMCIGAACMAWRWRVTEAPYRDKGDMYSQGYCGKAGHP